MNKFLIQENFSIKKTLKRLNNTSYKCLILIEKKTNILMGTVSDGDIRKALIKGLSLRDKVKHIYNKNPFYFLENSFTNKNAKDIFIRKKIPLIPIVNKHKVLKNVIFWDDLFKINKNNIGKKIDMPVLIMAGGKGTRLEPFTKVLPKPLIPINEKPVIEHIIENFTKIYFKKFYLSINYKSKILKAYFEEFSRNYKVDFIEEKKPLGTAGSLKILFKKINKTVLVTNCDIMINIDYRNFIDFHNKNKNDISFITFAKNFSIPYGICKLDETGSFEKIQGKTSNDYIVNAGMYIISPKVSSLIPDNKKYNMTDLIKKAKLNNFKIAVYPIDEDLWVDIGQWNEYKNAVGKL